MYIMNEGVLMVWKKKVALDIKNNLKIRGWQVSLFNQDNTVSLIAKKKILFFFSRSHLYLIKDSVKKEDLEKVEKKLENNNDNYNGLWFAAREFSEETINYAKRKKKIGLIKLEE